MAISSPTTSPLQRAILERLRREDRPYLDLQADADWLQQLTPDPVSVLHRMRAKGLVHNLQPGRYALNLEGRATRRPVLGSLEDLAPILLGRLGHEYFLSWHSALWHHGLLDQQAQVLYVADRRQKRPATVGHLRVHFVRVAERKFFGWKSVEGVGGAELRVGELEKALLDSFDLPQYAAPMPVVAEALRAAHQQAQLDAERIVDYALRFDSPTLNRRLGFFMDLFEIPGSQPLLGHLGRSWAVPLAPGGRIDKASTPVDPRWRVARDPDVLVPALRRR